MIVFHYIHKQHLSTLLPIYNALKDHTPCKIYYGTRLKHISEWAITSYVFLIKENTHQRYIWHHHGIYPFKGDLPSLYHNKAEYLLVASSWFKERFIKKGIKEEKIKVIGYPKLDVLINNYDKLRELTISRFNNLDNPIVLYTPSWLGTRIEADKTEILLKKLSKELQFSLIIKRHETSNVRLNTKDAIYLDSKENIVPYYTIADILITDISSTAFEFAHLDRPIIQVKDNIKSILPKHVLIENEEYLSEGLTDIGIRCYRTELKEAIRRSIDNPEEYSDNRKKWVNRINIPDGKSTERAISEIMKIVEDKA